MSKAKKIRKGKFFENKKEEVNNVLAQPSEKEKSFLEILGMNESKEEENMEDKMVFEYKGKTVTVKEFVGVEEMMGAVEFVVDMCFVDGEYHPEIKRFSERKVTILLYSDYELEGELPEQYESVYDPALYYEVLKRINENQYYDMLGAIEMKIGYKIEEERFGALKKINGLVGSIASIVDSFEKKFGDLSVDELSDMAKAFSDGGIDEEKIVDLFINKKYGGDDDESESDGVETEIEVEVEVDIEK